MQTLSVNNQFEMGDDYNILSPTGNCCCQGQITTCTNSQRVGVKSTNKMKDDIGGGEIIMMQHQTDGGRREKQITRFLSTVIF
jgi:hypothetical protein